MTTRHQTGINKVMRYGETMRNHAPFIAAGFTFAALIFACCGLAVCLFFGFADTLAAVADVFDNPAAKGAGAAIMSIVAIGAVGMPTSLYLTAWILPPRD